MAVTGIRPAMIYGPSDRETLAFFTTIKNGLLPVIADRRNTLSVVYAADCADALVRAVTSNGALSGRTYFVEDGVVYTQGELAAAAEQAMGRRALLRFDMPIPVLQIAAAATELWGKLTNTAQMLTLDKVNELKQHHWVCSGEGARKDLGWAPKTGWAQ